MNLSQRIYAYLAKGCFYDPKAKGKKPPGLFSDGFVAIALRHDVLSQYLSEK